MHALELKVPPPLVAVIVGIGMWWIGEHTNLISIAREVRMAAGLIIAIFGTSFSLSGVIAFRNARTTVNPMQPQATSSLFFSGVYRRTRNPMYLGLLLVLVAWAVWLASAWAW